MKVNVEDIAARIVREEMKQREITYEGLAEALEHPTNNIKKKFGPTRAGGINLDILRDVSLVLYGTPEEIFRRIADKLNEE